MVLPNARYGFCSKFSCALIAAVFAMCVLYCIGAGTAVRLLQFQFFVCVIICLPEAEFLKIR
jgi:hypothetical protein